MESKKYKAAKSKFKLDSQYNLNEAATMVKEMSSTKFDSSVDLSIRLGIDPKKSNQMVRGVASLPHGTGKKVRVLALCNPEKEKDAQAAGADYVGLDNYLTKIQGGWTDFDIIVTEPAVMPKIGKFGKILGPKGLMPNPKSGTVSLEIGKAIKEIKAGKIDFKIDKQGIIHTSIGKVSFSSDQIVANALELINTITRLKPPSAKGEYFKSIFISSTMSPSVGIDKNALGSK